MGRLFLFSNLLVLLGCVSVSKVEHATPKAPRCDVATILTKEQIPQSYIVTCDIEKSGITTADIPSLYPYACLCGADALVIAGEEGEELSIQAIRYSADGQIVVRNNPPPQTLYEQQRAQEIERELEEEQQLDQQSDDDTSSPEEVIEANDTDEGQDDEPEF